MVGAGGGVRRGQRLESRPSDRGAAPAGLIQPSRDELGQGRVEERRVARGGLAHSQDI